MEKYNNNINLENALKEKQEKDKFIENCYLNCNGRNMHCGLYKQEVLLLFDKNRLCTYFKVIQNDIIKINEGNKYITFDILKKLVTGGTNE